MPSDRGEGRKLTPAELNELLYAPPKYRCDTCGRGAWEETNHGSICDMRQPDGSRCDGVFARTEGTDAE